MNKTVVVIPTYNENDNILKLYNNLIKLKINLDILFVDDNSTDGTKEKILLLSKKKNTNYIFRKKKLGIGSAHKAAFIWCYKKKYKFIITMDGDGTHKAEYIKIMLKFKNSFDLIITSRFIKKNSLKDWPKFRIALTKLRFYLINILLKMRFDSSGAFRLINTKNIKEKDLLLAKDNGYSYFWESLFILNNKNIKILEIPIILPYRKEGSSKMKIADILNALYYLLIIFFKRKTGYYNFK
jgi:dolichol-phosphate mannosyltransferase